MELSAFDRRLFVDIVRRLTGIAVSRSHGADLDRIVETFMQEFELTVPSALYEMLSGDDLNSDVVERFISALTVGETHFFRNRPQFEVLEHDLLPELIHRRRPIRRLRVWSAGCATGEEPYSVAILLDRLLAGDDSWDVSILATDVDAAALDKARLGLYGSWSFREAPDWIQPGYFVDRDGLLEIDKRIRDYVTFAPLNLVEKVYPSAQTGTSEVDLIMCRNVFMYMHEDVVETIQDRFNKCLASDGWLMVGHAEPWQLLRQSFVASDLPGVFAPRIAAGGRSSPEGGRATRRQSVEETRRVVALPAARPEREDEIHDRARSLWRSGRVDEALRLVEELAASDQRDAAAPYLAARINADRLELDDAQRWVTMAVGREPMCASAHHLHGLILQEQGQWREALDSFRRCVYADPGFALGHFSLGFLHNRLGEPARACKSFDRASSLLQGTGAEVVVGQDDDLTAGRLREMIEVQKRLLEQGDLARARP